MLGDHNDVHFQGLAILLPTALFAFSQGGRSERLGAGMLLLSALTSTLIERLAGAALGPAPLLRDVSAACGLLFVAIRYSSLWLGPALLFYSGDLTMIAARLGALGVAPDQGAPSALDGLVGYLVPAAIAASTLGAMIRRRRIVSTSRRERPSELARGLSQ